MHSPTRASSRRGSLTTAGSRRGSNCPRISSDIASRLVLNALFGYIADEEWNNPRFMLPSYEDGSEPVYTVSDYMDAVEAVLSQLELELELAQTMSGIDPTATSTSSTSDLLDNARRNGIITPEEYAQGTILLEAASSTEKPIHLKTMMRFLQSEWRKQAPEAPMTPRSLQECFAAVRQKVQHGATPEDSTSKTLPERPKKYSVSLRRQSTRHSTLHVIPEPDTYVPSPPDNVQACCIVM